MDADLIAYIAVIGAAVGSFLNLLIDRLPHGLSVISPPSRGDSCQRRIAIIDLVPIFNMVWLRGKCRYCKSALPMRVPAVEVIAAVLFGLAAWKYGQSTSTWVLAAYVGVYIVIAGIDIEKKLILNKVVLPAAILAFLIFPFGPGGDDHSVGTAYLVSLAGGGIGFGVLLFIYVASRGGMGEGDVKLAALMGLSLGMKAVPVALVIAFLAGGATAIVILLLKMKKRGDVIPFGPFLSGGGRCCPFCGRGPILLVP